MGNSSSEYAKLERKVSQAGQHVGAELVPSMRIKPIGNLIESAGTSIDMKMFSVDKPIKLSHICDDIYISGKNPIDETVFIIYRGEVKNTGINTWVADGKGELISDCLYAKGTFVNGGFTHGIVSKNYSNNKYIMDGEVTDWCVHGYATKYINQYILVGYFNKGLVVYTNEYNRQGKYLGEGSYAKSNGKNQSVGKCTNYKIGPDGTTTMTVDIYVEGKKRHTIDKREVSLEEYEALSIDPTVPKVNHNSELTVVQLMNMPRDY